MISFGVVESSNSQIDQFVNDLVSLSKKKVLVGVPEEKIGRKEEGMNNATLAYIHDQGSPKANIPPRPFMDPGIKAVQPAINKGMMVVAKEQLKVGPKDKTKIHAAFDKVGIACQASIRNVINTGEDFTPLKYATKRRRLLKRAYLRKKSKEDQTAIMDSMHPLIDTGQLRNSISYVVIDK